MTGSGGCNRLFGAATVAGDSLTFGDIGTTRMACAPAVMEQEQKFLAALAATRSFRFDGPQLNSMMRVAPSSCGSPRSE